MTHRDTIQVALPQLTVKDLRSVAVALDIRRGRRVKGGGYKPYRKLELVQAIRRRLGGYVSAARLDYVVRRFDLEPGGGDEDARD